MAKWSDTDTPSWNFAEPLILIPFLTLRLSLIIALLVVGRKDKSFRKPFYVFYIALTLVDCLLVVTRPVGVHVISAFGFSTDIDSGQFVYTAAIPLIAFCVHAQSLLQTAIALNRFTAFSLPLKHASIWRPRTITLAVASITVMSALLSAASTLFFGIRNAIECPTDEAKNEMSYEEYDQFYEDHGHCIFMYWQEQDRRLDYGLTAASSVVCCVVCFALNTCSVTMLLLYRCMGKRNHAGAELRLFAHSLFMFGVHTLMSIHIFVYFNDEFVMIARNLGAGTEILDGPSSPIQGWLGTDTSCPGFLAVHEWHFVPCGLIRGVLTGNMEPAYGLTVRSLTQHVFALCGTPLLLMLSGHVRKAYFRIYLKWLFRRKTNVIRVMAASPVQTVSR